ncbi:hypothetical protein CWR43_28290 [Rhizobium sullae]|uniref:Uncharacterized protein n=1 Tax=Rhizobium sullae TaxID=50338 RepID=A0A2N0D2W6_RHISU|nr:hypothetical protein CWR43_28290 [Rhizobium sullae]
MGEIPEDIKYKAARVVSATRVLDYVDRETFEGLLGEHVSIAILAERHRCAEVAKQVAEDSYGDTSAIGAAATIRHSILST